MMKKRQALGDFSNHVVGAKGMTKGIWLQIL